MQSTLYDANLGSSLKLRQILDGGWRTQGSPVVARTTAGLDPAELYGGRADPVADFQSSDLVTILANIDPASGLVVSDTLTLPFQKRASAGTYAAGASHFASSATKALIVVTNISTARDQEGDDSPGAVASLEAHVESSDGTDPLTGSSGNSLAATAFVDQFAMGPVQVNGVTVTDAVGYRVNPGIEIYKQYTEGLTYPTLVAIRKRTPTIEIDVEDLDSFANSGGFGLGFSGLSSVGCFLRRRADAAQFESGAVHAKMSFATGISNVQTIRGSGHDDASGTIILHGKALSWSATNALP